MEDTVNEKLLTEVRRSEEGVDGERTLKDRIWVESKKMWIVAGPAIFTRFSTFGVSVISLAFIGHIGPTELAAYALVSTVLLRFANGILLGMASALETLCGQSYGAKQYDMLGVYLQRSWLILFLCSIVLSPVFIFTTPILIALGQDESIAEVAGTISLWLIPVIFSFIVSFTCQMFLQAQSKNMIIAYLAAFSLAIHVFLSWLLTVKYKFGLSGAMVSTILAFWIPNIGQLVYIFGGWCSETWKGFSMLAFKDLLPIIKLSLSSGVMLCLELWYNTILVLLTGNMKNAEVAIDALSICLNINGWEMMISLGFLAAASVRVSNELGRGSSRAAKFSIVQIVLTSFAIGFVLFIFFLFFRERLAYIFTESTEVAAAVADLSTLLACSILLNSIQPVLSGVAVGAGWQSTVAYVNLTCYYLIGIPVGVVLGYVLQFQVKVSVAKQRNDDYFNNGWRSTARMLQHTVPHTHTAGDVDEDSPLIDRIWAESKKMWIVAAPAIFTRFSTLGVNVISQAFIGHIGSTELAAFALVSTVLLRFAIGILLGMASALETLCGQSYGARQYDMLGIYLQRSWLILFLCSIVLSPLFIFTTPILIALGQDESIAEVAGIVSLWLIPVIFSFIVSFTCQMFLQAQSKNMMIAYLSAFSLAIHVLLSWLLTVKYDFGLNGAMISTILAFWIPNIGQLVYVFGGWCPETWKGFSMLAFKDLFPIIKLSLSSGVMLCLELWYNTILVLLTGNMKNAKVAIGALSICLNINGWEIMIALGFFAAASVRISNELGRGSSRAAKFSTVQIVLTSFAIGFVLFMFFLFFRGRVAYVFTNSTKVAAAVADLSPLLACSLLLSSIQPVLSGVAVGAGWQSTVAYVTIACYYLVGIPVGVVLGNLLELQVKGVWIGMLVGTLAQTVVLMIITYKTDWEKQVWVAKQRVNKWSAESDQQAQGVEQNA